MSLPVRIIVVLVIIIISFVFLARIGVRVAESVVNEKAIVEGCAATNKVRIGVEHTTQDFVSTVRFCPTIDKVEGKKIVPASNNFYTQDKEGAKKEIRDMVKNCWKMWVEGQEPDVFREFPNVEVCQMCYRFRVKDGLDVTLEDMADAMEEPYIVLPSGDNCDPVNGGNWKDKCDPDTETQSSIGFKGGKFCCYGSYACENYGGKCSKAPEGEFAYRYDEWFCPSNTKCYVKDEDGKFFSYVNYINNFGAREGGLYVFNEENKDSTDIQYSSDKIYAISFVSPGKKINCNTPLCLLAVGQEANILTYFIKWGSGITRFTKVSVKKLSDLNPGLSYVPNFIIISTSEEAEKLGCNIV